MVGALLGASRISVFPRGPRLKSEDGDQDDSCPHLQPLVQALPTFYFREEDSMMNAAGELILLLFLLRSSSPLTSFGVVAPPTPISASGQLCHILRTAVTHFLFPFHINLYLSQLSLVKNNKNLDLLSFQSLPENSILVRREDLRAALSPVRSLMPPPRSSINLSCLYFTVPCSICRAWRVSLINRSRGVVVVGARTSAANQEHVFGVCIWHPSAWKYVLMAGQAARHQQAVASLFHSGTRWDKNQWQRVSCLRHRHVFAGKPEGTARPFWG